MTQISYILGGENAVGLKFEKFPEVARALIEKRMRAIIADLEGRVSAAVPRSTGKLASEIASFVDSNEDGVVGRVKILARGNKNEIIRALSLEFGAHGKAKVRSYQRGKVSILARLTRSKDGMVSAYTRQANITEVDYMRGPLKAVQENAIEQLKAALTEATEAA